MKVKILKLMKLVPYYTEGSYESVYAVHKDNKDKVERRLVLAIRLLYNSSQFLNWQDSALDPDGSEDGNKFREEFKSRKKGNQLRDPMRFLRKEFDMPYPIVILFCGLMTLAEGTDLLEGKYIEVEQYPERVSYLYLLDKAKATFEDSKTIFTEVGAGQHLNHLSQMLADICQAYDIGFRQHGDVRYDLPAPRNQNDDDEIRQEENGGVLPVEAELREFLQNQKIVLNELFPTVRERSGTNWLDFAHEVIWPRYDANSKSKDAYTESIEAQLHQLQRRWNAKENITTEQAEKVSELLNEALFQLNK